MRLGLVTQVTPLLRVRLNGDTQDTPADPMSDFTGATAATEVLVVTVESRRFAWRVRT